MLPLEEEDDESPSVSLQESQEEACFASMAKVLVLFLVLDFILV